MKTVTKSRKTRNPPFGHRNPDSLTKQCGWCGKPAYGIKQDVWLCKSHLRREQNAKWPPAGGICDFCGADAPSLKVFNRAPMAGACYCQKCAPPSETDAEDFYRELLEQIADWPRNDRGRRLAQSGLTFWDAMQDEKRRRANDKLTDSRRE